MPLLVYRLLILALLAFGIVGLIYGFAAAPVWARWLMVASGSFQVCLALIKADR